MKLRIARADVPFLSFFLHDAVFESPDLQFDPPTSTLTVELRRPRYEAPHHDHIAFLPAVRYQVVPSVLRVPEVAFVDIAWRRGAPEEVGYPNTFGSIKLDGSTLIIDVDSVAIRAELNGEPAIELNDIGPPSAEYRITDMFTAVVRFGDLDGQLRRLRSDA